MNQYERIKSMTVDEFAEIFSLFQRCEFCINAEKENGMTYCDCEKCRKTSCKEAIKQWLLSEVEDE